MLPWTMDPQCLQRQAFTVSFDNLHATVGRNLPPNTPPPSTHWTGTLIDYTYFTGPGLELKGVYVSPSNLSDHRLVVSDWTLE